ncbi:MAG: CU044_2847 family protein [Chloroflexia bacterium]
MKRLVEFPLEEGGTILVEVESEEGTGMFPAARGERGIPERARDTFEAAWEKVRPAAAAIVGKLRTLHDPPDKVEVTFGLKMDAEAGAILASAGVEANFKVTLTWRRERAAARPAAAR